MTQLTREKRKGIFQNLLYGRCPYEEAKMLMDGKVLACPECDYWITPKRLVELLGDPAGPAWKHMNEEEKGRFKQVLA